MKPGIAWTNVCIKLDSPGGRPPRLEFQDSTKRYHLWLERDTLQPRTEFGKTGVLYANPLQGDGRTQYLRADSARWSPVIASMLGSFDLVAERKRLDNEVRQREREEAEERERYARLTKIKDAAPELFALVRELAHAQGVDLDRCKRWTMLARALIQEIEGKKAC